MLRTNGAASGGLRTELGQLSQAFSHCELNWVSRFGLETAWTSTSRISTDARLLKRHYQLPKRKHRNDDWASAHGKL